MFCRCDNEVDVLIFRKGDNGPKSDGLAGPAGFLSAHRRHRDHIQELRQQLHARNAADVRRQLRHGHRNLPAQVSRILQIFCIRLPRLVHARSAVLVSFCLSELLRVPTQQN